jgi:PAS domain S-box-containing protein
MASAIAIYYPRVRRPFKGCRFLTLSTEEKERPLPWAHDASYSTFDNALIGIAHVRLDGCALRVNAKLCEITGYSRPILEGMSFEDITHPDDLESDLAHFQRVLSGEIPYYAMDKRYCRADGGYVWTHLTVSLKRDANGEPAFLVAMVEDITDRKQKEVEIAFLSKEIEHRSRNLLTVISSLTSLLAPFCQTVAEFEDRLVERLHAIALSNEQLLGNKNDSASISALVRAQMTAFIDLDMDLVSFNGPDMMINAKCSQSIGLALYELTSNAFKYGALSSLNGRIKVSWTTSGTDDDAQFRFEWREISGAPKAPSDRRGFGTTVLETLAPMSVRGRAERSFDAEGIVWRLDAPLAAVIAKS